MSKRKDNYSVFVGHLSQSTTKEDLTGLFSKCGKIVEIFTLNSDDQNYAYGFVRYANKDSALQAVQELDKWQMNGLPMIVDLSRETKTRIQEEDDLEGRGTILSNTPPENQDRNKRRENSRGYIEDVINLSRFQECCNQINTQSIQTGNKQKINGDKLLNDISEMGYYAAPNLSSELIDYEAVELRNLTKKLLSHSYGCTEQGLSETDTKEFFLALEVIMDTIQSFTAFCNHGVNPEVLRQAGEVRKNQKIQNEQNMLQDLKPIVNKKEISTYNNNDGIETVSQNSGVERVQEGDSEELPGNQDIRHCDPQTYTNSTVESLKDLKMKEKCLKELLFGGQGSNDITGERNVVHNELARNKNLEGLPSHRKDAEIFPLKSRNVLINPDSDYDNCDLNMETSPQNISSLKNITEKTIPQEKNSIQKAYCTPALNNGDISSLKQLQDCQSDTENIRKYNSKPGLLGSAPVNLLPGVLNSGDGLLGPAPHRNHASLRALNTGQLNFTINSYKPGLLGSAPNVPPLQAPLGNSLASIHSINNSAKPSSINQSNFRNPPTWRPETCDKTLSTDNVDFKIVEQTLSRSVKQQPPSPSNRSNFSFGRGRGFLFKS